MSANLQGAIRGWILESIEAKEALLRNEEILGVVADVGRTLTDAVREGRRLFFFGNGGSAADSQHIAAEFLGRYKLERQAMPALALTTDTSTLTAIANDYSFEKVFARQIEGLGSQGDVAIGISTSGNSPNVLLAIEAANRKGMVSVGLTGAQGGRLKHLASRCICVPHTVTARIQEMHILVGHILSEIVETELFGEPVAPVLDLAGSKR